MINHLLGIHNYPQNDQLISDSHILTRSTYNTVIYRTLLTKHLKVYTLQHTGRILVMIVGTS